MPLSDESRKIVLETVREAGDHLKGKLPPCPFLKERNSYAPFIQGVRRRRAS